jgi:hypothetical protein
MSLDAARPVSYWPHYMPGPGAAIPYQLTPLAETALADPEPKPELEAGL